MTPFPSISSWNYLYAATGNLLVMLVNFAVGWFSKDKKEKPGPGTNFYGKIPIIFILTKSALIPLLCLFLIENGALSPKDFSFELFKENHFLQFLVFSWLGDLFLLIRNFFVKCFGVVSFATAHLALIAYNFGICHLDPRECTKTGFKLLTPMGFMLIILMLPRIFQSRVLNWAIAGYALVLLFSGAFCCMRIDLYPYADPKFYLFYLGLFSFTISDTILIIQEVNEKIPINNFAVLLTYGIAEALLCLGFLADQQQ